MLTLRFWLQATGEAQTVWVLPPYFPADSLEGREFGWESDPNLKRDAGEVGEIDATRARTIGRTGESLGKGRMRIRVGVIGDPTTIPEPVTDFLDPR